ncbi:chromatin assembly factor 1 subunit A-A isoform X2 [Sitodiplosis mosellana]|uniref:chromatin assembly factor 1 subunit A-A isoform X2 n=2 Tax=Sitodiplosis mosellana TaxID=263140 RepID=UPI002444B61A|nr:chromatin assembly factor 1 subunit A-A isoform X2 [Sitodiplosis mosellana]XP_055319146.1 chromatin assembly factor 1 subunit A-A isoform X2 [Sitodiplosis mosellana]
MQTSPCGHRVVCRRCFVKTIQSAVAQRLLPLRCVICRARINRLISGSATWRLQESASNYSVGTSRSWAAPSTSKSAGVRVAQSASLYSMSSGSSNVSGISYTSNRSNSSEASCSTNNSGNSGTSSVSLSSKSRTDIHNHRKHDNCGSHCLGAIPRNPQYSSQQHLKTMQPKSQPIHPQQQQQYHTTSSCTSPQAKPILYISKRNYTPKSASYSIFSNDMQNRLPPIKEFRSPTKASISSPSRVSSAPRLRFASYTSQKSKTISSTQSLDTVPLLGSQPTSTSNSQSAVSKLGMTSKVAPIRAAKPTSTRALASPTDKIPSITTQPPPPPSRPSSTSASSSTSTSRNPFFIISLNKSSSKNTAANAAAAAVVAEQSISLSSKECNNKINEKMVNENKRNEYSAEKRKKEEKLRLKAEKEARKEEKRQAKEEKKRGKKDVKYFSLLCDNKTDSKSKK